VEFPDIDGCVTSGSSLPDAIQMAEDALCLMLYDMEESGEAIPAPSDPKAVQAGTDALVSLVCCDTIEYRKLYNNKAVKKTLTIPAWLNTLAERADLNFSSVLQDALKLRLDIQ
jgi:antitoxin HicB